MNTITLCDPEMAVQFEAGDFVRLSAWSGYGASDETLQRRVMYGGRKGRSAARKLDRRWRGGRMTVAGVDRHAGTIGLAKA